MGMKVVLVLLFMQYSVHCQEFQTVFGHPPEVLWGQMEKEIQEEEAERFLPETKSYKHSSHDHGHDHGHDHDHGHHHHGHDHGRDKSTEAIRVPEYVPISAHSDQTALFKPERTARPVPDSIKKLLLATESPSKHHHHTEEKKVEVLCHIDRMYVRVRKDIFTNPNSYQNLKLGSCSVNQGNDVHYYMLYLLKDCGTRLKSDADSVTFTNKVSYTPVSVGPIIREARFDITMECRYNRFHLSYKVGFLPTLQGGTVYKSLTPKTEVTLGVYDENGKELAPGKGYIIGQPMYFEAKVSSGGKHGGKHGGKLRVYVNKCFMTMSKDYYSMPKYTVIDNAGCMLDGKFSDNSNFLSSNSDHTKFTISAFIFEKMASSSGPMKLYMHCELTMGPLTPTKSAKSCNYINKKWVEVNDKKSDVCDCCDTKCPSPQASGTKKMIASHSFEVDEKTDDSHVVETVPKVKMFKKGMSVPEEDYAGFEDYWDEDY